MTAGMSQVERISALHRYIGRHIPLRLSPISPPPHRTSYSSLGQPEPLPKINFRTRDAQNIYGYDVMKLLQKFENHVIKKFSKLST